MFRTSWDGVTIGPQSPSDHSRRTVSPHLRGSRYLGSCLGSGVAQGTSGEPEVPGRLGSGGVVWVAWYGRGWVNRRPQGLPDAQHQRPQVCHPPPHLRPLDDDQLRIHDAAEDDVLDHPEPERLPAVDGRPAATPRPLARSLTVRSWSGPRVVVSSLPPVPPEAGTGVQGLGEWEVEIQHPPVPEPHEVVQSLPGPVEVPEEDGPAGHRPRPPVLGRAGPGRTVGRGTLPEVPSPSE